MKRPCLKGLLVRGSGRILEKTQIDIFINVPLANWFREGYEIGMAKGVVLEQKHWIYRMANDEGWSVSRIAEFLELSESSVESMLARNENQNLVLPVYEHFDTLEAYTAEQEVYQRTLSPAGKKKRMFLRNAVLALVKTKTMSPEEVHKEFGIALKLIWRWVLDDWCSLHKEVKMGN